MAKLTGEKISLILLGFFILVLMWRYLYFDLNGVTNGWEYRMAIVSIVLVIYYIVVWKILKFRLISPSFFILLSMWLFHVSLVVVMGFKLHEYNPYIMLYRYGNQNSFNALFFSNVVITFYVFGLILFFTKKSSTVEEKTSEDLVETKICRGIGITLFFITVLPMLYTNYAQVTAKIVEGYSGTMSADTSFHGIPLGWFTKLFLPSILLIMASYKNNKRKFLMIMVPIITYYTIFMFFTGRKGNTIQTIAPILVMYFFYFKPKVRIVHLALVYGGLYIMTIVTQTRKMSVDTNFWDQVKYLVLEANPIVDMMYEMGGTIKAVIQMQLAVPDTGSFLFGLTYISGIFVSISNGLKLSIATPLNHYAVFADYLSMPERGALLNSSVASMGGSSIAEWWWNFGWFSIIFVLFFAKLTLNYENKLIKLLNNPTKLAIWCSFLYYIMRYTRGYITDAVWDPLFIYCFIMVIYKYCKKKVRLKNRDQSYE